MEAIENHIKKNRYGIFLGMFILVVVVVLLVFIMGFGFQFLTRFEQMHNDQMQKFEEMHADQIATNKNIIASIDSNTAQLHQMNDSIKYLYREMHVQKEKYAELELQNEKYDTESFMELVKYF